MGVPAIPPPVSPPWLNPNLSDNQKRAWGVYLLQENARRIQANALVPRRPRTEDSNALGWASLGFILGRTL